MYGYRQPPAEHGDLPRGGYPEPANAPGATASLAFGLTALLGGLVCLLPALAGPVAIIIGLRARKRVDDSDGRLKGRGQATTGIVTGALAIVVAIAFVAANVFDLLPPP